MNMASELNTQDFYFYGLGLEEDPYDIFQKWLLIFNENTLDSVQLKNSEEKFREKLREKVYIRFCNESNFLDFYPLQEEICQFRRSIILKPQYCNLTVSQLDSILICMSIELLHSRAIASRKQALEAIRVDRANLEEMGLAAQEISYEAMELYNRAKLRNYHNRCCALFAFICFYSFISLLLLILYGLGII